MFAGLNDFQTVMSREKLKSIWASLKLCPMNDHDTAVRDPFGTVTICFITSSAAAALWPFQWGIISFDENKVH